jgi:hypothetical protein
VGGGEDDFSRDFRRSRRGGEASGVRRLRRGCDGEASNRDFRSLWGFLRGGEASESLDLLLLGGEWSESLRFSTFRGGVRSLERLRRGGEASESGDCRFRRGGDASGEVFRFRGGEASGDLCFLRGGDGSGEPLRFLDGVKSESFDFLLLGGDASESLRLRRGGDASELESFLFFWPLRAGDTSELTLRCFRLCCCDTLMVPSPQPSCSDRTFHLLLFLKSKAMSSGGRSGSESNGCEL